MKEEGLTSREVVKLLSEQSCTTVRQTHGVLRALNGLIYKEAEKGISIPGICSFKVDKKGGKKDLDVILLAEFLDGWKDYCKSGAVPKLDEETDATSEPVPEVPSNVRHFSCPGCGLALEAPLEFCGQQAQCSDCSCMMTVPEAENAVAVLFEDTSFEFPCPSCGKMLQGTDESVGIEASCPFCSNQFTVQKPGTDASEDESIEFNCLHCSAELEADLSDAGLSFPCPSCGRQIEVPSASKESQPAADDSQDGQDFSSTIRINLPTNLNF